MRESPTNSGFLNGKTFVLTAVLGNYQGQRYALKPGQETIIGRDASADIVFDDTTVSRRHVKVLVVGDDVIFEDLGSTNGTFVDGKRITRIKIKPGDLIVIGSNMVNVASQPMGPALKADSPGTGPVGPVPRIAGPHVEAVGPTVRIATPTGVPSGPVVRLADDESIKARRHGASSMSGQIDQIPLTDLIQLMSTSNKTGVLEVRDGEEVGHIHIKDGLIEFASIEDCPRSSPKKAFCRMMLWKQGLFELLPPRDEIFEAKINEPVDVLLLEAMRHHDEFERLPAERPDLNAMLSISTDQEKPLHSLSANHLNMVQLILSHGKVRKILYHSPLPDYETYRILIELIQEGFVKEEAAKVAGSPLLLIKSA